MHMHMVYFFNGIIGYILAACFSYKISFTSFCCSHSRTRRERRMRWREMEKHLLVASHIPPD